MPRPLSPKYCLRLTGTANVYVKNYTAFAMVVTNNKQEALNGPDQMIETHICRLFMYGYTVDKVATDMSPIRVRVLLGVSVL